MPHQVFTLDAVADYLHLTRADIEVLLKRGEIPFEVRGGRRVFRKIDIDAWASQRILGFSACSLDEYHEKTSRATRQVFEHAAIMPEMVQREFINPRLAARTRASAIREMVALAERTGRVCDAKELLTSLEAREELCSTGLAGGLALLHPRHHQAYMFDSSFIVLGRAVQEIHFGAEDGLPTDLFFLVCCQDDRIHLHTLARLCMMAMKTGLLAQLRAAPDAPAMHECLLACEVEVLGERVPSRA